MPRYSGERQSRYRRLRRLGFLSFEARELSSLTTQTWRDTPYIVELIRERVKTYTQAKEEEFSYREWLSIIREWYTDHDWGRDFWRMFRQKRQEYIDKHPEYDPDYTYKRKKPPKTKKLFDDKYETGKTKYPRGAAYR